MSSFWRGFFLMFEWLAPPKRKWPKLRLRHRNANKALQSDFDAIRRDWEKVIGPFRCPQHKETPK